MPNENAAERAPGAKSVRRGYLLTPEQQRRRLMIRRLRSIATPIFSYGATTALAIIFTFPFFWMVSLSFRPLDEIAQIPPALFPHHWTLENFAGAMTIATYPFALFLENSAIYTILATIGILISSAWVAYGFARLEFIGKNFLFLLLISTVMLPHYVTLIPQYLLFHELGWLDSLKPLVVPAFFGSAFDIFLMRQFFLTIPRDLDEAALVDGSSRIGIFFRIIVPLSMPIIVAVAAFAFIARWNDLIGPLIYLNSTDKQVAAVALALFQQENFTEVNLLMAAGVVTILPIIVVFLFAQKSFVQGVTLTGLKEG